MGGYSYKFEHILTVLEQRWGGGECIHISLVAYIENVVLESLLPQVT